MDSLEKNKIEFCFYVCFYLELHVWVLDKNIYKRGTDTKV